MRIAVVGLGLIGGSLARALAAAGHHVCGYDADPGVRAVARTAGAQVQAGRRWKVAGSVADAVDGVGAELVVLAVPLPAVEATLDALTAAGFSGLVTDTTSVKLPVRTLAWDRRLAFVGGHPMAGRETSGFDAGDAALFDGCAWALCLEPETSLDDWLAVADLITHLGARVVPTDTRGHDTAAAAVSHVPHLAAAALAVAARVPLYATLAAGSYRDGTRVAASSPDLVAAMCGGNADAVGAMLDRLLAELSRARAALDSGDPTAALRTWLSAGHDARLTWPPEPGPERAMPVDPAGLLELGQAGGWITDVQPDRRTVTAVRPVAHLGRGGSPGHR